MRSTEKAGNAMSASTSTSNATLKQAKRLLEFFDEVGATTDQVQQFLGAGDLVMQMILSDLSQVDREAFAILMEGADPTSGTVPPIWYPGLFQQIDNVFRWLHTYNWEFVEKDIPDIPVGELKPSSPLCAPVLAVYLPDKNGVPGYIRTVVELCREAGVHISPDLILNVNHLRLLPGTEEAHEPGIRWVMPDLEANWNGMDAVRPVDVRNENSAHAEVLAAAAHFPGWVKAMDGSNVPGVWLPGYQYRPSVDSGWEDMMLRLGYVDGRARLIVRIGDVLTTRYATPERRLLPAG